MPSKAGTSEILETAATFRTSLTESPELRNLLEPIGTRNLRNRRDLSQPRERNFRKTPEPARTRRNPEPGNFPNLRNRQLWKIDLPKPSEPPRKPVGTHPNLDRSATGSRNPVPSQNRSSPRTHRNHPKSILRKKPIAFCCWETTLGGNVKTKGWDGETDKRQTDRHILSYGGIKNASFADGSRKGCDT